MKFLIKLRKWTLATLISCLCIFSVVLFLNAQVESLTEHQTFSNVSEIKHNRVGLVLGTSKRLGNGNINLFFRYRIDATLDLFNNGKIDFVLVSGDNGRSSYDEPTDFKDALIAGGIPESKIYLDYAGFRTLDSVVRAKKVFGLKDMTIISQKFHNQRALVLADHYGINAVAYNAKDVQGKNGLRVKIREYFARTKLFIDLVFGVKPKFLGKQIEIV